jgi:N-dimethylarginine dimethylaminohydrolase
LKFGSQSEVDPIKSLLLKHPRDAFVSQENIQAQWNALNYSEPPDYDNAIKEYDEFSRILEGLVPEIHYLPSDEETGLDSIYVHDSLILTNKGAVLCSMGKEMRRGEPSAAREFLEGLDIPILGSITDKGRLEGGDVVWMDERTVVVGMGYRTNPEGIRQFKELIKDLVDELTIVPLPHWEGPEDVMHLMSLISPVRHDLSVVYSRLLPVPFREWLLQRGIRFLDVPDSEFGSMGCNVLAVAPGKCVMLSGNPMTKRMLEEEGVEVYEYTGEEISKKGAGGPTCLTRPLLREKT